MPKLYDIPMELAAFEAELLDADGVVTEDLEARWKDFVAGGKAKIEAAAMVVRTLEASAESCAEEAQRLKARGEAQENNARRLKDLMITAVDAFGGAASPDCGKVKTSLFTIWTQNSAKTLSIEPAAGANLEELEEQCPSFVRTVRELNKKVIKEDYEAGKPMPDCLVIEEKPGSHYLRIK